MTAPYRVLVVSVLLLFSPFVASFSSLSSSPQFLPSSRFASSATSTSALHATAKKQSYSIALLPGDGIGPEITDATVSALSALQKGRGFTLNYVPTLIGGAAIDATGDPFPKESLEKCKSADSVLLACIGGYKWDALPRQQRPESGLLRMRSGLGLYANLRPAKVLPQLINASTLKREVIEGVDIMVVRELMGDVYFGAPKGIDALPGGERVGYNNMIYSTPEIRRIAKVAFDVALKRKGSVHSIDKSNVLDVSQLWKETVIQTHAENPAWAKGVALQHM